MYSNEGIKGIFILPVTSQPRFSKRINEIKKNNIDIKIFSFERSYFNGDTEGMEYHSLGFVKHGNYVERIITYKKAYNILKKYKKDFKQANFVYVFGIDLFILIKIVMKLLRIKKHIYCEIADIREIFLKENYISKLARLLERHTLKSARKIILTSPYFYDSYYKNKQKMKKSKFLIIENKLIKSFKEEKQIEFQREIEKKVVLGFFGLLRCKDSWNLLKELACRYPEKYEIYIRGFNMSLKNFSDDVNSFENIFYEGEFKSPNDLNSIYEKVDISVVGNIGENNLNAKLALPNRLYEGLAFHTPMIAQYDSGVGKRVNELDIGWTIDFSDLEGAIETVNAITKKEYLIKYRNTFVDKESIYGEKDHLPLLNNIYEIDSSRK